MNPEGQTLAEIETEESVGDNQTESPAEIKSEASNEAPINEALEKDPEVASAETVKLETEESPEAALNAVFVGVAKSQAEGASTEKSPDDRLGEIDGRLTANEEAIASLRAEIASEQARINELRGGLGAEGAISQETPSMQAKSERLAELEQAAKKIKVEKEQIKAEKELQEVYVLFLQMPKEEQESYRLNGKGTKGESLKTPDGKEIPPEVAKKLGEASALGVKEITAAVVKALIIFAKEVMVGLFTGIVEGIAG